MRSLMGPFAAAAMLVGTIFGFERYCARYGESNTQTYRQAAVDDIMMTGFLGRRSVMVSGYLGPVFVPESVWDPTVRRGSSVDIDIAEQPFGVRPYCTRIDDGVPPGASGR
jgi:hypothetical protein